MTARSPIAIGKAEFTLSAPLTPLSTRIILPPNQHPITSLQRLTIEADEELFVRQVVARAQGLEAPTLLFYFDGGGLSTEVLKSLSLSWSYQGERAVQIDFMPPSRSLFVTVNVGVQFLEDSRA